MIERSLTQQISFDALRPVLSEPRLEAYRTCPEEAPRAVLGRYCWNIALSRALYPVLSLPEVALRNGIHRAVSDRYGTASWYDRPAVLAPREQEAVLQAKNELKKQQKPEDPNRLVAELSFGFWTSLLSRNYEPQLWPRPLMNAFPHIPRKERMRVRVAGRLNEIRRLRNRVSHHEPIWKFKALIGQYRDILETVRWLSPELPLILPMGDRFDEVYRRGASAYEVEVM